MLVDGAQGAGWHDVRFDAAEPSSGVYLYRVGIGSDVRTGTMLLTK